VRTADLLEILPLAACALIVLACSIEDEQRGVNPPPHDPSILRNTQSAVVLDPAETAEALQALEEMSEFLGKQSRLSFEAEVNFDVTQPAGHKLEFGSIRKLTLRRPDRASLVVQHRDGLEQFLYFDGESFSAFVPSRNAYAREKILGTVEVALDSLVEDFGVPAPLGDLIHPDLYSELKDEIESGSWVGEELIGGVPCDHMVYRAADVDFQIWIEQGDRALPHRLVITYRQHEGAPQFRARFINWNLSAETPDDLFTFIPPAGSKRVSFSELYESLPPAVVGE
jgi:hypothetical protein